MEKVRIAVVCAFGLEAIVKRELQTLGYHDLTVDNGWIMFDGTMEDIIKTNICLRSAERILIIVGEFQVEQFSELYDQTSNLPWEDWIVKNGTFPVSGKSVKSKLFSISDCQSIVKKGIVDRLRQAYDMEWMPETGSEYAVQISIHKDWARLTLDTTGSREGLFKRGYRKNSVEAPIKETMAAAMVQLSFWNKERILLDPMCGSGTIVIEAALMGTNTPPGLYRIFASEQWQAIPDHLWHQIRDDLERQVDDEVDLKIFASDNDPKAIEAAKMNAKRAGVDHLIQFKVQALHEVKLPGDYGIMITNPPYGDRISDMDEVQQISQDLGKIFGADSTWSSYIITPFDKLERFFGKKASRKRKLFNGNVKVNYYQFFGEKKPSHE